MRILRLVVDNDRSPLVGLTPELQERARARQAAIDALTRPRVLAFREASKERSCGRELEGALPVNRPGSRDAGNCSDEPPALGMEAGSGGDDAQKSPVSVPWSSLAAHPTLVAIAAALLSWALFVLSGGAR